MKKFNYILFIILMLFVLIKPVNANNDYTIEIPSSFKKDKNKDYWQKEYNNEKISILIYTTINNNQLNLDNLNTQDINADEYLNALKTTFEQLGYKINSYSSNIEKTTLNGYSTIVMEFDSKYTLESNAENTVYQKQYMLTSKKNIYYIIVSSSNKSYLDKEEINKILSSFKINDKLLDSKKDIAKYYMTLAAIVCLGIVIAFIFSKKK